MNNAKTLLCAIAKNESPYLVEWVAYHKYVVGFNNIVIYTNDSIDNSHMVLDKLKECELCEYKTWPRQYNVSPQYSAYKDSIEQYKNQYEWICFLDIDEFLVLKNHSNIHELIYQFSQKKASSICFNWLLFGSSYIDEYDDRLVTQKFLRCANTSAKINRHYKCISKISDIEKINIHINKLKNQCSYYHVDGTELFFDKDPNSEHINDVKNHINHDQAQINHYQYKSLQEYKNRKLRGRASCLSNNQQSIIKPGVFDHQKYNDILNTDIQTKSIFLECITNIIYKEIDENRLLRNQFQEFIIQQSNNYDNR